MKGLLEIVIPSFKRIFMLKDKYVYVCKYCGKIKKVQINEYFDGLCDKCKEKMTIFGKEYITKESN